jgi:hypothetical protein
MPRVVLAVIAGVADRLRRPAERLGAPAPAGFLGAAVRRRGVLGIVELTLVRQMVSAAGFLPNEI